jgi:hypothetical protein
MGARLLARDLRTLAQGMPHRSEATALELAAWLVRYRPEMLSAAQRTLDAGEPLWWRETGWLACYGVPESSS